MHKQNSLNIHLHSLAHHKQLCLRTRTRVCTSTSNITLHTRADRRIDGQGECAGSAVSAFSGMSKYPCLNKASDMLRKASRITTVSTPPPLAVQTQTYSSSEPHPTYLASHNFTLHSSQDHSCVHATSDQKYADRFSLTHLDNEALLCCADGNQPITRMWFLHYRSVA